MCDIYGNAYCKSSVPGWCWESNIKTPCNIFRLHYNNSVVKEGFFIAVDKNTSFFLRLLFHTQMIKSVRLVNVS